MSGASPLPADVALWPGDPYELLGVSRRASPDEVRAAHARLSAAFDPAGAPAPRRRLADARDLVLRDLDLLMLLEAPPTLELQPDPAPAPAHPEPPPEDLDLSEALRAVAPPAAPPGAIAPAPLPPAHGPAALWQAALAGQEARAYRGLVALHQQGGASADVCLRLYWLLTAAPELDRERAPADWLVRGLVAEGLSGPPWELYRQSLADRPDEALSPHCARLLGAAAEPDALADLALARWQAAARLQKWDVIASDLQVLRGHLPAAERPAWARLWGGALDQLVWSDARPARELAQRCFLALGEIPSDSPEVVEARKRQNILRDLAAGWRKLRSEPDVPAALLELVPPSWSRPFAEVRPRLLAFLAEALPAPLVLLRALDALQGQPAVLGQFGRMLGHLHETLPAPPLEARSSSDLAELAFAFLDTSDRSYYRTFRPALLDFCLREAVAPEVVADLAADHTSYWLSPDRHLSEVIRADEPLSLAYLAHELFWA